MGYLSQLFCFTGTLFSSLPLSVFIKWDPFFVGDDKTMQIYRKLVYCFGWQYLTTPVCGISPTMQITDLKCPTPKQMWQDHSSFNTNHGCFHVGSFNGLFYNCNEHDFDKTGISSNFECCLSIPFYHHPTRNNQQKLIMRYGFSSSFWGIIPCMKRSITMLGNRTPLGCSLSKWPFHG